MTANETSNHTLPRAVARALDAMRAHPEHGWTVPELSAAVAVSIRTLQRQFRVYLGKSPYAVLRDIRFASARRELLRGLRDVKIMDIAATCGFSHFGRFSTEYRRRFGETPSRTWHRQATLPKAAVARAAMVWSGRNQTRIVLHPIECDAAHAQVARHIEAELAAVLSRVGIAVARQPGSAPYALTSAIRGAVGHTRLTFRLIETETGRHLWADRSNSALAWGTVSEAHLAGKIVAALQPTLRDAEIDRALRKPDGELSPRDLALQAIPAILALDAQGNARALDLLERAMDRDPGDALATALAAWAHSQRVVYHLTDDPAAARACGLDLARRAQRLAADATVLAILGNAFTVLNEVDTANLVIRQALALDGGSAWAWSRSGWIDLYEGDAESAIERLKIALGLAPQDPLAFNSMVGLGCANFHAGRYAEAARWQQRALIAHPSAAWAHRTLCAAHVLNGADAEARRSLAALRHAYPELTVSAVQSGMPPFPQRYRGLVAEALHAAGLPL